MPIGGLKERAMGSEKQIVSYTGAVFWVLCVSGQATILGGLIPRRRCCGINGIGIRILIEVRVRTFVFRIVI